MSLLWVSNPTAGASSNLVRAHVAKNTHAAVRRQRMARYRAGLRRHDSTIVSPNPDQDHDILSPPYDSDLASVSPTAIVVSTRDPSYNSYSCVGPQVSGSAALAATPSLLPINCQVFLASQLGVQGTISEFESFLVKYYVHAMIPFDEDEERLNTENPSLSRTYKVTMLREWLPAALGTPQTRMGLYLCACRSLHARTGSVRFYRYALQYKAACLRLLGESIAAEASTRTSSTPVISDTTMSAVLQLASDELAVGDMLAWCSHASAIDEMVKLSGGLDQVRGMKGLLRRLIEVVSCEDALHETRENLPVSTPMALITLETLLCM